MTCGACSTVLGLVVEGINEGLQIVIFPHFSQIIRKIREKFQRPVHGGGAGGGTQAGVLGAGDPLQGRLQRDH